MNGSHKHRLPRVNYFFPNLIDQVFEIGEIRIQSAQNETNIRLVDDVWRVQQQDSYFANIARVQNLIVGMSQLRMLEKKTSVAERLSELGLEGVGNQKFANH